MIRRKIFGTLILAIICLYVPSSHAQNASTGKLTTFHLVFSQPSTKSDIAAELRKGTIVKLKERGTEWYEVYNHENDQQLGFVYRPKVELLDVSDGSVEIVDRTQTGTVREASYAESELASQSGFLGDGATRYLHQFTNVRRAASGQSDIVMQLPPGSEVKMGAVNGNWAAVYDANNSSISAEALFGYVYLPLLKAEPPSKTETTMVYITRTGTKFHTKECRHLRQSKFAISLEEAMGKKFEACKVCKPGERAHDGGTH